MMISLCRRFALVLGFGLLAACTDVPQSQPCPSAQSCAVAQLIADELSADVGTDYGGGVTLRQVQAAGARVVIDLELPLPGGPLEQVQKKTLHDVSAAGFVSGFCEGEGAEDVFAFGNSFQMRSFGNDGVILGASTITSCGG